MTATNVSQAFRALLAAALLALIAAVGAGVGTDSRAAAAVGQPNVVVIMTDDQTAESMRVMARTRNLIADQGMTFANSFVNLPLCCPSRATFLTGQYAHNHEVTTNSSPHGGFYKFDDDYGNSNLATALQGAGYHTALVGKYLNEYGDRANTQTVVPSGWSDWHATLDPNPRAYNYELNENGTVVTYGAAPGDYKGDVLTGKAVEVIETRSPSPTPFFLWLSYTAPHGGGPDPSPQPPANCNPGAKPAPRHAAAFDAEPLPRPPSFNEEDVDDKPATIRALNRFSESEIATLEQRYRCALESLLSVDEGVEDVVTALSASGELDNTLIVFTSDNGFFYGEHRLDAGKSKHYEPSTRVPLLIRGPGVTAGVTSNELVSNADLAPTILDAAVVAPPVMPDGLSLFPLLAGGTQWDRDALLIENRSYAAVRDQRYVYVEHTGDPGGADPDAEENEVELYDLTTDPHQLQNLHGAPAYAELESSLAQRLATLRTCAGASCHPAPESGPAASGPADPGASATDPGAAAGGPPEPGPAGPGDTDPPETTITKSPAKKGDERKLTFRFAADEPGSSFACRIDKRAFRPCDSDRAERLRVGEGRHTFRVVATDSANNVDPTAAKRRFRVLG